MMDLGSVHERAAALFTVWLAQYAPAAAHGEEDRVSVSRLTVRTAAHGMLDVHGRAGFSLFEGEGAAGKGVLRGGHWQAEGRLGQPASAQDAM
jgi:hypothetical protein